MSIQMVLLPVFVLVALTLGMLFWTGRRGGVTGRNDGDLPNTAPQLDLLFYTLIALGLPLRKIDLALVCLSWVFVIARFVGAGFIAGNRGAQAWLASALVLLAMWFYFALRMLLLI
ncbi:MAPEG family protein [soil metagenome]